MRAVSGIVFALVLGAAGAGAANGLPATGAAGGDPDRGLRVWKRARCAFCHGWAGDGRGHPRSPGAAPSLRASALTPETMREVIRCGVPGTPMPRHDSAASSERPCYGMRADELEPGELPPLGERLSARALDDLVAYIGARVLGRGAVTLAECEAYFRPGSRNCAGLAP